MTFELRVKGIVTTGNKRGKDFVNLSWVKTQIREKLGFNPYLGTLNLKILNKSDLQKLHESSGLKIKPEEGYCEGKLFKALVMKKIWGAVVLPDIPEYPTNTLEIITSMNLRKTLGLNDGDKIEIIIELE